MTAAPSPANMAATVLLPLPRPPVNPTRSILGGQSAPQLCCAHCVCHQHGNGKRPDAAGNGSIGFSQCVRFGKHIPNDDRTLLQEGFLAASIPGKITIK